MKTIEGHDCIKSGMRLYNRVEQHQGDVINLNGVLQTNCMGWGYEPISGIDINETFILRAEEAIRHE